MDEAGFFDRGFPWTGHGRANHPLILSLTYFVHFISASRLFLGHAS